jgi:arylsulfatase A-like enzyme
MTKPTTRRDFLKYSAAGAGLLAFSPVTRVLAGAESMPATQPTMPASAPGRPNIVLIYTDDLGWGEITPFEQKVIQTPNLDRMAAEGMKLTALYSMPLCSPSRACLILGQHGAHTIQGGSNEGGLPWRDNDVCFAKPLKAAGYATAHIGKWAMAEGVGRAGITQEVVDSQQPWMQGFDYVAGNLRQAGNQKYTTKCLEFDRDGSVTGRKDGKPQDLPVGDGKTRAYWDDVHTDKACAYIKAKAGKGPFFMYLAFRAPHAPIEPPTLGPYDKQDWSAMKKEFEDRAKALGAPQEEIDAMLKSAEERGKPYAATITYLDGQIGKVMQALKDAGIDDNTLVLFTSDNGSTWSKRNVSGGIFRSAGPFRGGKFESLEGGIRMSAVARWPGKIKPGSVCDLPLGQYEFASTAAELAGAKCPASWDGESFLPELLDKPNVDRMVVAGGGGIRVGAYKATVRNGKVDSLVDLAKDPRQEKKDNLAGTMPELEKRIVAFAEKEFAKRPANQGKGGAEGED